MKTGHKFRFGLRQIEGNAIGLGKRGDQKYKKADELRNDEPS